MVECEVGGGGCEWHFNINIRAFTIMMYIFFLQPFQDGNWQAYFFFFFFCTKLELAPRTKGNRPGETDS